MKIRRQVEHLRDFYDSRLSEAIFWNGFDDQDPMNWLEIRIHVLEGMIHDIWADWMCKVFGHKDPIVEEHVIGDYEDVPDDGLDHGPRKLIDINGGRVEWYCPRCGEGGSSWF